jgi:hypothetical protein
VLRNVKGLLTLLSQISPNEINLKSYVYEHSRSKGSDQFCQNGECEMSMTRRSFLAATAWRPGELGLFRQHAGSGAHAN